MRPNLIVLERQRLVGGPLTTTLLPKDQAELRQLGENKFQLRFARVRDDDNVVGNFLNFRTGPYAFGEQFTLDGYTFEQAQQILTLMAAAAGLMLRDQHGDKNLMTFWLGSYPRAEGIAPN